MSDKDQKKSKEELKKQFAQEVENAESKGMTVGFACSKHKHFYYNETIPTSIYKLTCHMMSCKECLGHLTFIPVVLGRAKGFKDGYGVNAVETRNKSGEFVEGEGGEWKEYLKEVYSKAK
ncbi:hypothetical protein FOQG_18756 [Fusarium oxysporum f. sp. raphani 54005]|uniref:Uncharacterized protein n=5 Tax=Fusarium oxysporum TaxID=5507 RepID=X0BCF1_FUSOX|nr:hypothetical protein FOQG_18756 [Fusarium oxysporum f. sp. raphani 54005]EXL65495.1 hypothetical protein FOPG_18278 [Fusarium oxysporum f. sp. conglutinans race 2 54008]EXM12888.1 hypothetical protein FOTG_18638 [Fusarium oxysporum f. sp. vasinfectum 25433]KAG7414903.1 hypothetical protein Forpi1262_v016856 [Fusarium oxysporum f. sp. raphani]KAI3572093.1 hypothetical protein IWW34DRAFT_764639 [Fusarium oxysporum f. sp. albedinis]KAI8396489.1 hypothetical protein FOFC_21037 [Fusarium oxyspor